MRRSIAVASPADSDIGTNLPSTSVVDMFGRLFGGILATLLEKCRSGLSSSVSGEGIVRTDRGVDRSSDGAIEEAGDPGGDCGAEGSGVLSALRKELSGLKKRVSELIAGTFEATGRPSEIVSSAGSLSDDQGGLSFTRCHSVQI
jgi:hypothetical protein